MNQIFRLQLHQIMDVVEKCSKVFHAVSVFDPFHINIVYEPYPAERLERSSN